jgi:hypothetical protein
MRNARRSALFLFCVQAACLEPSLITRANESHYSIIRFDSHAPGSSTKSQSVTPVLMTRNGYNAEDQDYKKEGEQKRTDRFHLFLSDYSAYTDPSRFRPTMFQQVYDDFQSQVSKDITHVIASGISYITQLSLQSHFKFVNAIFLAILLPFITIPMIAVALPFICIKNFSIALVPTISFDLFLKIVLSSAYVIQRPSSVVCILEGWIKRRFNRKPNDH